MSRLLSLARYVVVLELRLYRSLLRWVARRPDVPAGAVPFSYVGAVAVLLWAFIIGSAVELVALHVLLPWETVRLVVDILSVWGLVWMVGYAASLNVHPHLVGDDGLRIRHSSTTVVIPWEAIGGLGVRERGREKSRTVQVDREAPDEAVVHVVVASRTNVDVVLRRPTVVQLPKGPETVTEVRVFADDPRALVRLARERLAAGDESRR